MGITSRCGHKAPGVPSALVPSALFGQLPLHLNCHTLMVLLLYKEGCTRASQSTLYLMTTRCMWSLPYGSIVWLHFTPTPHPMPLRCHHSLIFFLHTLSLSLSMGPSPCPKTISSKAWPPPGPSIPEPGLSGPAYSKALYFPAYHFPGPALFPSSLTFTPFCLFS